MYQRWQRPQLALEFYRQASQRAPAELAYLLAQGEMLVVLGRTDDALQLLEAKVTYFENSPTIRDAVGQILMEKHRYAEAVDMFRQASVLSEDDQSIRERLAMAYYRNKQYPEAVQTLTAGSPTKTHTPSGPTCSSSLGDSQLQLGDTHAARNSFERATELDPTSASAWRSFGRAALQAGDLRRADFALKARSGLTRRPANPTC